jgi:hypothetical protein
MHGRILNRSSSAFALARYSSHDSVNNNFNNMSLAARVAAFVNLEQQQQQQHAAQQQAQQQQQGGTTSSGPNSLNVSPMNGVGTLGGALVFQSRRDELTESSCQEAAESPLVARHRRGRHARAQLALWLGH